VEVVSGGELGAIKRASEVARILFWRFGEERVDI
jgi:hypothetical protein